MPGTTLDSGRDADAGVTDQSFDLGLDQSSDGNTPDRPSDGLIDARDSATDVSLDVRTDPNIDAAVDVRVDIALDVAPDMSIDVAPEMSVDAPVDVAPPTPITCAVVAEGQTLNLQCPPGQTIELIDFASYGNPNGSCGGSFSLGSCHRLNTQSTIAINCAGQSSCSLSVNNGTFGGDPCAGTVKRLAVRVQCLN